MKKYMLGIVAFVTAICLSAFTTEKKNPTSSGLVTQNFTYNDYPNDTWKNDPAHYTLISGSLSCPSGAHRCGVNAQNDGTDHPVLSGATVFTKN